VLKGIPLPDWKQLGDTPQRRIKGRFDELSKIRKFRESVPDWMDQLGERSLGSELWTKELAALLNVSVRSLELKRYRLRKKLDLSHEENLIDFLLSIDS